MKVSGEFVRRRFLGSSASSKALEPYPGLYSDVDIDPYVDLKALLTGQPPTSQAQDALGHFLAGSALSAYHGRTFRLPRPK